VKAALKAMTVKTDRNDARGMAQLMRMGLFHPVHAKTLPAQDIHALLAGRRLLLGKLRIRGILRGFGLKVGEVSKGRGKFTARIRELVNGHPMLESVMEAVLQAQASLQTEYNKLHRQPLTIVRGDVVCCRTMAAPGVGAVVAMTLNYRTFRPPRTTAFRAFDPSPGFCPTKAPRIVRAHPNQAVSAPAIIPFRYVLIRVGSLHASVALCLHMWPECATDLTQTDDFSIKLIC